MVEVARGLPFGAVAVYWSLSSNLSLDFSFEFFDIINISSTMSGRSWADDLRWPFSFYPSCILIFLSVNFIAFQTNAEGIVICPPNSRQFPP